MARILDPTLDEALSTLGATNLEKAMPVGYLENQVASAEGQANGLRSSAADLARQADAADAQVIALRGMLDKFTNETPQAPN